MRIHRRERRPPRAHGREPACRPPPPRRTGRGHHSAGLRPGLVAAACRRAAAGQPDRADGGPPWRCASRGPTGDELRRVEAHTATRKMRARTSLGTLHPRARLRAQAHAVRGDAPTRQRDEHEQRAAPAVPLYLTGARVLEVFPVLPLIANEPLGVGALWGGVRRRRRRRAGTRIRISTSSWPERGKSWTRSACPPASMLALKEVKHMTTIPVRDVRLFVDVVGRGLSARADARGPGRRSLDVAAVPAAGGPLHRRSSTTIAATGGRWRSRHVDDLGEPDGRGRCAPPELGFEKWAVLGHSFGARSPSSTRCATRRACRTSSCSTRVARLVGPGKAPELLARRGSPAGRWSLPGAGSTGGPRPGSSS